METNKYQVWNQKLFLLLFGSDYHLAFSKMAFRKTLTIFSSNAIAKSLQKDAKALSNLSSYYENNLKARNEMRNFVDQLIDANRVLITGIGKSGYVARRMAASLASVGIPSHFVHGTEWVHGDLGVACKGDIVVGLSHSGNTEELVVLPRFLQPRDVPFAAIIGSADSALGKIADNVILAPAEDEILGKVPSRSIIAQEAIVNAIIEQVVECQTFTKDDFIVNHPGGSIGKGGKG